ncbi:hypothetical protein [Paracoccus sp. J56]|uniref:hypothetical protein n=1 Tax=Paracoccus sp. J56 TaxID=935850 RepID=UPI001592EBA9|nr:hypothetical protein [Paracoccus sp. J56]
MRQPASLLRRGEAAVIDDWPEEVPITEVEIQVFERWFADVFDGMFGSVGLPEG